MYPRINYEMTEQELETILDACKPVPIMMIGNYVGSSPQENANRAWKLLGDRMGFDSETVQPIEGKDNRFFSAVPTETEFQRVKRLKNKAEQERIAKIAKLKSEISDLQNQLFEMEKITPNGVT